MKMNRKMFTLVNGTRLTNIHSSSACAGEKCVIHNPMRTYDKANLIWRNDRGIFEVVCEHGCGHPAPEQKKFLLRTRGEGALVHGCCWQRCCLDYYKEEASRFTSRGRTAPSTPSAWTTLGRAHLVLTAENSSTSP